jgi:hypothetical protein
MRGVLLLFIIVDACTFSAANAQEGANMAPKDTPPDIIEKLNNAVNAVLADPRLQARLAELGGEPMIRFRTSPAKPAVLTFSVAWSSPCMILARVTGCLTASDNRSVSNATNNLCCLVSLLANSKRYGVNWLEATLSTACRRDSRSFVRKGTSIAIRQVAFLEFLEMSGLIAKSPSAKVASNLLSPS